MFASSAGESLSIISYVTIRVTTPHTHTHQMFQDTYYDRAIFLGADQLGFEMERALLVMP